jgi:hypothetical protein
MAFGTFVKAAHGFPAGNVSATTVAATFGSAVTAGNLLVAFVTSDNLGGPTGVSDSVNGAWTAASSNATWAVRGDIYFFKSTGAGTPVVTATWGAAQSNRSIFVAEYTGAADSTTPNDKNVGNGTATPTTTPTSTNVAPPTQNGELFFSGIYTPSNTVVITAGASLPYTIRDTANDTFNNSVAIEDAIQVTAASIDAGYTLNQSLAYVCCLSTFKAPATPNTVTIESSMDGTTWVTEGTVTNPTASPGATGQRINVKAVRFIRANVTSFSSGDITVELQSWNSGKAVN